MSGLCCPGERRGVRSGRALWAGVLAALGASACEIPTDVPKWDTTWVVPADSGSIEVNTLLPGGVTVASGGTAFELSLPATTFSVSLAEGCGAPCAALNGVTTSKPPFTASLSGTAALPADVESAAITGGQVQVQLRHDFGFDPLRPSATARGYFTIAVSSGGTLLARDSVNGATTAFPAGTTLTRTLTLGQGTVAGPVLVAVTLVSPAGDPVTVNTAQRLTVTATPSQVRVGQAQVRVSGRQVTGQQVTLDFEDVDDTVRDRVRSGALLLRTSNPFGVTGTLQLTITAPGVVISRPVQLRAGESTQRVELTGEELRSILGTAPVRLTVAGAVSGAGGVATVRPGQVVGIGSQLELVIGTSTEG